MLEFHLFLLETGEILAVHNPMNWLGLLFDLDKFLKLFDCIYGFYYGILIVFKLI